MTKVPVTVITGFLGSGKTTLLNHILTEQHGLKIAVIENEFGEVGVDDALLKQNKKDAKLSGEEEIIEMNNGCICCTVRGDLIKFLKKLESRHLDLVLIETTGLADPAPVAQTFFVDDGVQAHYKLDSILTVVDAKHIIMHLDEVKPEGVENECVEQVAFADVILLNKIDLVTREEIDAIKKKISAINQGVEIIETINSKVDIGSILGKDTFSLERVLDMDPNFLVDMEHQHDLSVTSVGFSFDYELEMSKLQNLIQKLLDEKGTDLYRYKGVLPVKGMKQKFVFQGVHMLFGGTFCGEWEDDEPRQGRFIFIGKNLDKDEITKGFLWCKAKSLRFKEGDRVYVKMKGGFKPGDVIRCWDEGNPYRVRLEASGINVWAPDDDDSFIRKRE